jgi:hypothetical protein
MAMNRDATILARWQELSELLGGLPMPAAPRDAESVWPRCFLAPMDPRGALCAWQGHPGEASEAALKKLIFSLLRQQGDKPEEWAARYAQSRASILAALRKQLDLSRAERDTLVAYMPVPQARRWIVAFEASDFPDGVCRPRPGYDPRDEEFDPSADLVNVVGVGKDGFARKSMPRSLAKMLGAPYEEISPEERQQARRLAQDPVEMFVEHLELDAMRQFGLFDPKARG